MAKRSTQGIIYAPVSITSRWISLGYGIFAAFFFVYAWSLTPLVPGTFWPTPVFSLALAFGVTAPLLGLLLAARKRQQQRVALGLVVVVTAVALALVALTGGLASPFWGTLLVPMISALLLLPQAGGVGVATAVWLGYSAFLLVLPPAMRLEAGLTWILHTAIVWIVLLLIERMLNGQKALRRRAQRRELALHSFLEVSNRLRVSTNVQTVLEEVANAVQVAGDFDCVTLSQMNWQESQAQIAVAIGVQGQRLGIMENLTIPWDDFANVIERGKSVGAHTTACETLPFRTIRNEYHLVLPLIGQFGEIHGILTVSAGRRRRNALREALPLLEILANQAATALDNTALFSTLEQRVQQSTMDLERGADELRRARDRAEVLYHIVRALSVTLDERQVLERTLSLVAEATEAERGGILLIDQDTNRLVFSTMLDRHRASGAHGLERSKGLARWVLAQRKTVIIPDTSKDSRWQIRSTYDTRTRSVLAVPLMLETEVLGVLILLDASLNHFHEDHAQLVMAAASQAAVALSKAQLYRYVSEQSERLSVMVQQLEEEASKRMAILRSIGDGVIVGDQMGRIRMINPTAERILGINAEVFLGRPLADLPGAPRHDAHNQDRLHQITLGERTMRAHFAPVVSSKDEPLGSVVVYHDITREVLADKLKSEFVATASHELRTPLTSIRGYVDMLMLGTFGTLTDPQQDFLAVIKNNVGRLVELVDELLDISRAEAGETRLRREEVNVAEVLQETTQSLQGQFSERAITLNLQVQNQLPRVMADRQRLQQIIVNLVGNACKYTPQGGYVNVALCNGNNELRVDVRDSGVGIAESAQPHIFTPFFRADNPLRDEVGGTGLGLSITRKLVELHGGQIWFESCEGRGSMFSFTLPLQE